MANSNNQPNDDGKYKISFSHKRVKEIYADGCEIIYGMPISKINFTSIVDGEEVETKIRIAVPTHELLGLATDILANMKDNEQTLLENIDDYKKFILEILNDVNINKEE